MELLEIFWDSPILLQDYYKGFSNDGKQGTDAPKPREGCCEQTFREADRPSERQTDPSPYSHFTAADWAAIGYGVAEWVDAGYTAQDLKAAGYTARDLAESGLFGASQLLSSGYSVGELAELDPDMARECGQKLHQADCNAQTVAQLQLMPPMQPSRYPSIHLLTEEWQEAKEDVAQSDDEIDVEELLALCVS